MSTALDETQKKLEKNSFKVQQREMPKGGQNPTLNSGTKGHNTKAEPIKQE